MLTRRDFLAKSLVGAAAVAFVPLSSKRIEPGVVKLEANTWYHVFAILEDDQLPYLYCSDGTIDNLKMTDCRGKSLDLPVHLSRDLEGPGRRVGSITTDSRGKIRPFQQTGATFFWN